MKSTDSTYLKPIGLLNVLKSTLSLGCPCVLFYLILSRNKTIMETAMLKNKHMLKGDNYPADFGFSELLIYPNSVYFLL